MPIANTCRIGYPHDGRADNAAYRNDSGADKQRYRHDRRADSLSRNLRIRVVSALGRFGLSRFGLGRFGQFWGWVVSALVGGSFRPIFWVSRFGPESFRPKYTEIFR